MDFQHTVNYFIPIIPERPFSEYGLLTTSQIHLLLPIPTVANLIQATVIPHLCHCRSLRHIKELGARGLVWVCVCVCVSVCVWVCVCVSGGLVCWALELEAKGLVYMYVCVCECVCVWGGGLVCWALELEAKGPVCVCVCVCVRSGVRGTGVRSKRTSVSVCVCVCVCVCEVWCAGHWGHTGKQTQTHPSSFFDTGVSPVPTLAFPHQLLFTTGHFSENDVMLCAL